MEKFFTWFQSHKGYVDRSAIDIVHFPISEGGRGAIALKDVPQGYTLFSIPRSLVLGTRTSALPSKFGIHAWKSARLDEGWTGIILCLMWEAALGSESTWSKYFDIMPDKFDTPMFWDEEDLVELKGTAVVVDKIGKDSAESDYREKIVPVLQSRPDLFKPADIPTHFSLGVYHTMGTRLLSRSFTLNYEEGEVEDVIQQDQEMERVHSTSAISAMDVDSSHAVIVNNILQQDDQSQFSETIEEVVDLQLQENEKDDEEVVLVPLADMLNARFKENNVQLFFEPDCLKMISSRPIKAGEQIWNTYGDPPNSVLLCGFGHVDYIPLPAHLYGENVRGNPGDVVEIRADIVVKQALETRTDSVQENDVHERIDWWLEMGGDDVFELEIEPSTKSTSSLEFPPAFVSFTRLILFGSEWDRSKVKGKPPRPKAELLTLKVIKRVLEKRLEEYATTLDEDEQTIVSCLSTFSANKRNALILRVGEKRILHTYLKRLSELLAEETQEVDQARHGKRKASDNKMGRQKKRKY